ncbi:MAG: radical SAM protein [Candidatus Sumerlaeia bacterium]|nr:radical SAM protein [Candidatus Sumerlaeia bacterium]
MMDTLSYGQFSLRVHQHALRRRIPCNGALELTYRCPLNCLHCWNNQALGDKAEQVRELTADEWKRILDEIAAAGCLWVLLTGGEPLARPDFPEIYLHAKQRGLLVTLFTNGMLVTPEIADYLAAHRPFQIEITLYGHTRETHERITRVAGSYDRCWRGIHLLLERRLPLTLKTVVMATNCHELPAMKRHVEEHLNLRFRFDGSINCRLDCGQAPLAVRLSPEEIVALDAGDAKRVAEYQRLRERQRATLQQPVDRGALFRCGAGMGSFAVNPYGMLNLCLMYPLDGYDLRAGTFAEGWQRHLPNVRARRATQTTRCTDCTIYSLCGMCPAYGQLENRDPEAPVDFLCCLAHLRARTFGFEIRPHGECPYCDSEIEDTGMP